ncbi:class I lanthipeptide [Chryseobacterium sp. ISL-6]|uniref:class I lanthipeptide n=1 Tax=Chryseobacterium sp. ISL-6 TaxID=2819143 RepID=UPI001BEB42A1|nr:class I lanthipeptide [Chryseobacterium sp. ISL-6]MBT2620617.1 class I lanthipeptide [Chryseobacterium sp. ISL-6]
MKKKKVLKFSKETVTKLDKNSQKLINGGKLIMTGGCTDGCGPLTKTHWNCTEATCTDDCDSAINCAPTSKSLDGLTCTYYG